MQAQNVVNNKAERVGELLHRTHRGEATLGDRLELQVLVLTCDGPTYQDALAWSQRLRRRERRTVLTYPCVGRFAA